MRIYIEHGATRALIAGPFNLAGRPEDLRRVAVAILEQVEDNSPSSHIQVTAVQPPLGDARPVTFNSLGATKP